MTDIKKSEHLIDARFHGMRLDMFLHTMYPTFSRSYFQKLIRDGGVTVREKVQHSGYRLHIDDTVVVVFHDAAVTTIAPEDIPLTILYEDSDIIVVNKPSGMVVHPGCGNVTGTLVNALIHHCNHLPVREGHDPIAWMRPGLVHRLDKDTSGVMVIAKTEEALNHLAKQFTKRTIEKTYWALCYGSCVVDKGVINASIGRDTTDRKKMHVGEGIHLREAVTHFVVQKRFNSGCMLMEATPKTGRTHQIRVHFAYIGCPILGDPVYGSSSLARTFGASRTMLHAYHLSITHPRTHERMQFTADIPHDFVAMMQHVST